MKYLLLFHILPGDIVKIIINYLKIHHTNKIINFYRIRLVKEYLMKGLISSLLWIDNYFITSDKIRTLNIIINNNWSTKYNRYFWCCFTNLLANRIMKDSIHIQMMRYNNKKYYNEILKKITKLWFKLCKKYNLVLNITFYNFKSKKAEEMIRLPAKNFAKPINNFHNILYTPTVEYNEKNNYNIIEIQDVLDTLNEYSSWYY